MPTFLAKVFSRGKDKDKGKGKDGPGLKEPSGAQKEKKDKRASRTSSLLEGKFENVSPSVAQFEEKDQVLGKEKEGGKEKEKSALFRPKSRTTSGAAATADGAARKTGDPPQLTLDLNLSLPGATSDARRRDLSVVYEGDAGLDDAALGEKRLSAVEALGLMRACLAVLTSRGLDTLGVMHPHWHSASPATQRKIISLFLSTLSATPAASSVSSPTSAASASAFETELGYVRSPHDVAAVFRWALRHLRLSSDAFDRENTPSLAWYDGFSESEKAKGYPLTAYSDLLVPVVKPEHAELLETTLSLVSRLASHSEVNGVSGSKLSMFLGHYLLTGNRVEKLEDWIAFYSQWERAGRALEHIFLASLRDEESKTGIPKRLSELIVNYPYSKFATDNQFPRPARFATRAYDALYVRITFESAPGARTREEVHLPLQIIENALQADAGEGVENAELVALWDEVKKAGSASETAEESANANAALDKSLSNMLSDESIRILSLKNDGVDKGTPTISMFTPVPEHEPLFGSPTMSPRANGKAKAANGSTSISRQTTEGSSRSSPVLADWSTFSSAGFGESSAGQSLAATLLDNDLEKTEPAKLVPRKSLKKNRSPGRASRAPTKTGRPTSPTEPEAPRRFKTAHVSLVKIDESFIDFWSDALLDPISNAWPTFVVCQLKADAVRTHGDKKLAWLVVEQKFLAPTPPPEEPASPVKRASSPRPSVRSESEGRPGVVGRVSATFTSRKRFNFFGGQAGSSSTTSGNEKRESKAFAKGTRVNEMGEVIPEGEVVPSAPKAPESKTKEEETPKQDTDKADSAKLGAATLAVGAGAMAVAAEAAAEALAPEAEKAEVPAAQNGEPVKEESTTDVPSKDVEPAVAELAAEEPAPTLAAGQELASQVPTNEPQVTEAVAPQTEATHGNAVQIVEPEANVPEVLPGAPESAAVSEAPAPVAEVAEPQDSAEPTSSDVPAAEIGLESPVAGAHHGAGESRFVEHIETPPDEKTTGVEPTIEQAVEAEPLVADKEEAAPVVPETIQEEAPEPVVAEPEQVVEKADELPTVSEVAEPKQEESAAVEGSAPPAALEEELAPPIIEDSVAPSDEGTVAPADVEPTHVPVETDEPTSQIADESKEETLPAFEESTPAPSVEPTVTTVDEQAAPAVVEEESPAIEEPSAPQVEQPTLNVTETTPVPEEESSAPVVEESEALPESTPAVEDQHHVTEPIPSKEIDSEIPISHEEPALANGEAPTEATPAETSSNIVEPEEIAETHTEAPASVPAVPIEHTDADEPSPDHAHIPVHEPTVAVPSNEDGQPTAST